VTDSKRGPGGAVMPGTAWPPGKGLTGFLRAAKCVWRVVHLITTVATVPSLDAVLLHTHTLLSLSRSLALSLSLSLSLALALARSRSRSRSLLKSRRSTAEAIRGKTTARPDLRT
jgi:hypothetical protein